MHCASCARIIEKNLSALDGVQHCDVNIATEQATITSDTDLSVDSLNAAIAS